MSPLRALARPLLASAFILDGVDALRNTDKRAEVAQPIAPTLSKASEKVPGLPRDTRTLTRLIGAIEIAAGVLLATGKAPRLAAGTLAAITIPTALVKHPVWAMQGEERREHMSGLLTSAALLGGLIFAAQDRAGKPSLGWQYDNWRGHRSELRGVRDEHRAELTEVRQELRAEVKEAKAQAKAKQARAKAKQAA
jgi:putative oxidoreductase